MYIIYIYNIHYTLHNAWTMEANAYACICAVQQKACESLTYCENEKILQPIEVGLLRSPC